MLSTEPQMSGIGRAPCGERVTNPRVDVLKLLAFALCALLAAAPAGAQDARKWAEALATYQKFANGKEGYERARAIEDLGNATSPKWDRTAWQLSLDMLRKEIQKEGQGGKTEERVSGEVLDACVGTFKKVTNKDVLAEMTRAARAKGESVRLRIHVLWGLGPKGEVKDLLDLLEDPSTPVQIAAADALAERADAAAADAFIKVLQSDKRSWEVKLASLQGLEKVGKEEHVDLLIESLGKVRGEEGRLKEQYLKTLKKITAVDLESDDPNLWKSAWAAKKSGGEVPPGATIADPTEFYGLKTRSTRIVFILDRTGSMQAPASEPARTTVFKLPPEAAGGDKEPPHETQAREEATKIKKKWEAAKPGTRMDVARKELILTVWVLHPKVHFNVIWYEGNPHPWKQELLPATWLNKLDCLKETDRLVASGPTNIWDAVETAFKMTELPQRPDVIQLDRKANYAMAVGGSDTFFLMTDGQPNTGRIVKPEDILSEIRKVNRLRRVTVHTICMGDLLPGVPTDSQDNPDPKFLKKIADENGGEFVHLKK